MNSVIYPPGVQEKEIVKNEQNGRKNRFPLDKLTLFTNPNLYALL